MIERQKELENKQKCPSVDLAIKYIGMGHILVLSYDLQHKKVFVDRDGGSNGYDRLDNMTRRMNQDNDMHDMLQFQDWFQKEKEEKDAEQ